MSLTPNDPGARRPRPLLAYGSALGAVAAATLAAVAVDAWVEPPNLSLIFVLPVVFCAVAFGWGPALTAAFAGVVAYNFFLIAPRYTFQVADPANVWALGLLAITAATVSAIAARARRRAVEALTAAGQAQALQALARALVGETDRAAIARRCAEALAQAFGAPAAVLLEADGQLAPTAAVGGEVSAADLEAARWALGARLATRGGAYPAGEAAYDFWPVLTPQRQGAAIGLAISGRDGGRPAAPERLVEIVGGYLAVALDRQAYAEQALAAGVREASDRLKSDLLAAVSHDLKTPLSTILFTLQSLRRFADRHDAAARDALLAGAEAESARLGRMVENLLDMNRVEAGALAVRAAPVAPAVLAAGAVARAGPVLDGHKVVDEARRLATPLQVDAGLFESALANLLENAAKYSPAGSTIGIHAGRDGAMGWIEVVDEGPGFGGAPEAMFGKFVRGREGDGRPPGVGLGLSIARSFLEAQGGRVEAVDRTDRSGARVRVVAPLARRQDAAA